MLICAYACSGLFRRLLGCHLRFTAVILMLTWFICENVCNACARNEISIECTTLSLMLTWLMFEHVCEPFEKELNFYEIRNSQKDSNMTHLAARAAAGKPGDGSAGPSAFQSMGSREWPCDCCCPTWDYRSIMRVTVPTLWLCASASRLARKKMCVSAADRMRFLWNAQLSAWC